MSAAALMHCRMPRERGGSHLIAVPVGRKLAGMRYFRGKKKGFWARAVAVAIVLGAGLMFLLPFLGPPLF
jgi:hypothetical protein